MSASADWIESFAQRLGVTAPAATIFGEPIERGEVTVVCAARPYVRCRIATRTDPIAHRGVRPALEGRVQWPST